MLPTDKLFSYMKIEYKGIPKALEDNYWKSFFKREVTWTFQISFCVQLEVQPGPGQDGQTHIVNYIN